MYAHAPGVSAFACHAQPNPWSETAAARQLRECCPCCQQAPETPTHFLFECPAYAQARNTVTGYIANAQANQGGDPRRTLLAFEDRAAFAPIASFVPAAWQHRRAVLTEHEANGVSSSMALLLSPDVANDVAVAG